jgi:hypothetical protein
MKPLQNHFIEYVFVALLATFFSGTLHGQQSPTAGYDTTQYHPVFIQSEDGQFSLNLGLYTQFRYNATYQSDVPDSMNSISRGYSLARTRIFLEGNLTKKFYYHTRFNINPSGNIELIAAYLQWNLNDKMWIRGGRQFMALSREDWMYPHDLASIEFSANDFTYAIWSSFGFQFRHVPSNKFRYFVSVGNGAYGGRQGFPAPNPTDVTLIGRGEWNILGSNWGTWDEMVSRRGRDLGFLLGFSGGNSRRDKNNLPPTDFRSASQFNLDFSAAGNGFHLFFAGSITMRDYENETLNNTVNGFYSTLGYWVGKQWFGYGRFDYVGRGDFAGATEDYVAPGIGITYYPFLWTNRTRFTLEYNALPSTITNTIVAPDGQLGWTDSSFGGQQAIRLQIQFGF